MKFTELSACELAGGTVTEWSAHTELTPDHWAVDHRPLTYEHEALVTRAADAETHGRRQTDWLGAAFEVEGELDQNAMERTLLIWTVRHEAFRTTVTMDIDIHGDPRPTRRTATPEMVSVQRRFHGRVADHDIDAHVGDVFDTRVTSLVWPHCTVMTVTDASTGTGRPTCFRVVFAADHSVMDAYSMLLSINELQRIYESEAANHRVEAPAVGSHVDYSSANRCVGEQIDTAHPALAQWHGFFAESDGRFPRLGMPLTETLSAVADSARPIGRRQRGSAEVVATADEAAAVEAACRAAGHSIQTGIVAGLALAHQELTGDRRLRAVMPMHTRHEPQFVESVGWYVGLGPLDVDLSSAETLSDALSVAAAATRSAKTLARLPFPRFAQLLDITQEPQFVVSYLDLRMVPGAAHWPDWRAQTIRSATHSDSEVYVWIARTPTGITVSTRHPDSDAAAASIRRLIDTTFTIIASVVDGDAGRGLAPDPLPGRDERRPA